MPLQPGEAKPMPAMPREFLTPVAPDSKNAFPPNKSSRRGK